MEDLTKTPTVDLIKEMTRLDYDIDLMLLQHEKIRGELVRRFPPLEQHEEFKPKTKILGGGNNG